MYIALIVWFWRMAYGAVTGPGSSIFLFEGLQTVNAGDSSFASPFISSSRTFRYLHCGDFRASPRHVLHPAVKGKSLHHVYLDTTYLDPKVWKAPISIPGAANLPFVVYLPSTTTNHFCMCRAGPEAIGALFPSKGVRRRRSGFNHLACGCDF